MKIFRRNEPTPDSRDTIGQNSTGRPRRSSSKSRRQAANKLERDLKGSRHEADED